MKFLFLLWFFPLYGTFSETRMHFLSAEERASEEVVWEELATSPFNELILSWNGARPLEGRYSFLVSVRQDNVWSPWLYYAEWGSPGQIVFKDLPRNSSTVASEGYIKTKQGTCDAFRIQVQTSGGSNLKNVYGLSVCTTDLKAFTLATPQEPLDAVFIDSVPRQSQITLRHARFLDLALPTAMTILLNYFFGGKVVQPLAFADKVIDDDTGWYENWSLNVSEASHLLEGKAFLHITRLPDFAALHAHLLQGYPVIAAISGWGSGFPRPYRKEHAVCIIGYDPAEDKVYAIDSAFPNDKATFTAYPLSDFLKSWAREHNKAIYLKCGGVLLK
jgi:hypothetical protein